jgi:hypothetical protein
MRRIISKKTNARFQSANHDSSDRRPVVAQRIRMLGLFSALLFLTHCAATPDAAPPREVFVAQDYYALDVGNTWVYKVSPAPEGQDVDTVSIVSKDSDGFFIDDHGGRLQARKNGIFDGDRFLIEDPLEVDHNWIAVPTPSSVERYKIMETNKAVSVPAGNFSNCVVVQAEQPGMAADGREITIFMRWTYAPHVGLVELRQSIRVGEEPARQTLERRLVEFRSAESNQGGAPN